MSDLTPRTSAFTLREVPARDEVIRIDAEGFHYLGQFIADAGEAYQLLVEFLRKQRQAPADGEVAELVAWLRGANWDRQRQTLATRAAELLERLSTTQKELERERLRLAACGAVAMADTPETAAKARDCLPEYWSASADDIARQIDKLMRLSPPQPVPVAERLPGPEDCDAEERCWLLAPRWILPPSELTHWLPATALPLPEVSNG